MHLADLSVYPDKGNLPEGDVSVLSIGWLDDAHEYKYGEVSLAFLDRLWNFCRASVLYTMGYYQCALCTTSSNGVTVQRGQERLVLGSAEIRVFGNGDRIYAAPDLIYHYVTEHQYRPPDEFIQAVLTGPLPKSPEYEERMKKYGWSP